MHLVTFCAGLLSAPLVSRPGASFEKPTKKIFFFKLFVVISLKQASNFLALF